MNEEKSELKKVLLKMRYYGGRLLKASNLRYDNIWIKGIYHGCSIKTAMTIHVDLEKTNELSIKKWNDEDLDIVTEDFFIAKIFPIKLLKQQSSDKWQIFPD